MTEPMLTAMPQDPAFTTPGRFWKGNIHTHSDASDGVRTPDAVCAALSGGGLRLPRAHRPLHGEVRLPIVDTRPFRTAGFTTILGAELHAPATSLGETWHILAVGLPLDFARLQPARPARRSPPRAAAGAFVAIPHPGWYALTAEDAATLQGAHAVEVYNHTSQLRTERAMASILRTSFSRAGGASD